MAGTKATNNRKPYSGDKRALVLAFDVGTTFSGVSYAFLEPGEVPKIHGVTRYPGQEHVTGNTKIPSLLYYDRDGNVRAAGAEAEGAQIDDEAEDQGWSKVELFKLRLRPRRMELDMNGMRLSPLPAGKSSEDVFGDFLHYLFTCTRKFIEDTHANGKKIWRAVEKDINFVLSHPNGWEGAQQSRMRRSAIGGGLIPNTDEGRARIRFVTEGEASMHACILSGLAQDVLASGNGFIVADAGGGTLDISSYVLQGTHPLRIEEVAPPDCLFSGAVFVSRRCRVFLAEKLRSSKYGSPDTLDHITKRFDETTKRLFRDSHDAQYIPFGSPLDKDLKAGIRGGQLKLDGTEVAELFEPSIQAAVHSIRKQVETSRGVVKAVWLVGGFAASPWLFSQLQVRLAPLGVTVNRPDTQTSKAVADGAIGFFCDHHVSARMSRYMYGVEYLREIDVNDQEHVTRSGRQLQLPSGPKYLPDAFDCILAKNVRVKESSVFSRKYYTEVTKLSTLSVFEIEIWCYRGGETIPRWIDRNSDHFGSLCFVRADLSKLSNSAEPKRGANGQTYWTVVFSIEIHFGLTEFKSRMKWNEDGRARYGPATIVFNEKGVRSDEDDARSVMGGDESAPASPRRPYGSLVSHRTKDLSPRQTQAPSHSTHTRTPSYSRTQSQHSHNPPPPPPAASVSRASSGLTDATSVEIEPVREPSPPPPLARSTASTVKGVTKSRGLTPSTAPSRVASGQGSPRQMAEPLAPASMERPPSRAPSAAPPASPVHTRTPSVIPASPIHSRAPSVAAPTSPVYSRTPSAMSAQPSVHSRAPSTAHAPSAMHSRAPSAAPAPSVAQSRAPSAAYAPSPVPSRTPSAAPAPSPIPSRAASAALAPSHAPSRAPSAAPALSPVPSRAPSVIPARDPSPVPSRPPSVAAAPSHAPSHTPSHAPSHAPSRAPSVAPASSPVPSRAPSAAPVPSAAPSRAPSAPGKVSPAHSRAPSVTSLMPPSAAPARSQNGGTAPPSRVPSVTRAGSTRSINNSGHNSPMERVEEAPPPPALADMLAPADLGAHDANAAEVFADGALHDGSVHPPAPEAEFTSSFDPANEVPPPPSKRNSWVLPSVSEVPQPQETQQEKSSGWGSWGLGGIFGGAQKPAEEPQVKDEVPLATWGSNAAEAPFVPPAPEPVAPPAPAWPAAPVLGKTTSGKSTNSKAGGKKGILKAGSAKAAAAAAEAEARAKAEAEAEAKAKAEADEAERLRIEIEEENARLQAEMRAQEEAAEEARARQQAEEEERAREQAYEDERLAEAHAREQEALAAAHSDRVEAEARKFEEMEEEARAREQAEAEMAANSAPVDLVNADPSALVDFGAQGETVPEAGAEDEAGAGADPDAAGDAEAKAKEEELARLEEEAAVARADAARLREEAQKARTDADFEKPKPKKGKKKAGPGPLVLAAEKAEAAAADAERAAEEAERALEAARNPPADAGEAFVEKKVKKKGKKGGAIEDNDDGNWGGKAPSGAWGGGGGGGGEFSWGEGGGANSLDNL